ncbi:MAG: hypothetical protein WA004_20690 [Saprospiraceae bacterium]
MSRALLLILLLADAGYSFFQHYHVALDGDLAPIAAPSEWYAKVLGDPLGLQALLEGERYAAPNRFFAHWTMAQYFRHVPLALQSFLNPIDSVYAAAALAKTAIQLLLVWLLASYASGRRRATAKEWLLAAVLITPLFQTFGYNGLMGIIDKSVTYTFFFALPMGLLLLFFLPFYKKMRMPPPMQAGWAFLALFLALSGPLVPGVVLVACLLTLAWQRRAKAPISRQQLFFFGLISLLSLYSLYIGTFNAEQAAQSIPLPERYLRLPGGLASLFTLKIGLPLLVFSISVNGILLRNRSQVFTQALCWVAIFSLLYLLLLPLGGYRDYRPDIVRRDTMMPVFLGLFFLFGLSSMALLQLKRWYAAGLGLVLLLFTLADEPGTGHNACEKSALQTLSRAQESPVRIPGSCTVMSWEKITAPSMSEWNARMLERWGITEGKVLYVQE